MNPIRRIGQTVRRLTRMVWSRWRTGQWTLYGRLGDERNYAGLVGDGTGSALASACIDWIINAFTQMRPVVQRLAGDDELSARQVPGHKASRLLRRPTFDQDLGHSFYTWMALLAGVIVSFVADGNAYILKIRSAASTVVQLWYVPHYMMQPRWDAQDPTKFITGYDYAPDGAALSEGPVSIANPDGIGPVYWVDVRDVIHLRDGLDPQNPRKGMSKLRKLLREIYTDEEAARFTASLLRNKGAPGLVISPKQPLQKPEDANEVKEYVRTHFTGDNVGEPMVLKGPTEVTEFGFSPDQLKLGDIRDVPEERVSAALGIPAAVVGFGAGLQSTKVGATMSELVDLAWMNGVLPRARIIAAELTEQLLSEFEPQDAGETLEIAFDTSQVPIMADFRKKEAETIELLSRWGVLRRADARKRLGLPVGVRDEVYLLSSGLVEVDANKTLEETHQAAADEALALAAAKPQLALPSPSPEQQQEQAKEAREELERKEREDRRADRAVMAEGFGQIAAAIAGQKTPEVHLDIHEGAIKVNNEIPEQKAPIVTIAKGAVEVKNEIAAPAPAPELEGKTVDVTARDEGGRIAQTRETYAYKNGNGKVKS